MNDETKKILTIQDIVEMYGLSKRKATQLLKSEGCPILPRAKNQQILVYKDAWEKWLMRGQE